MNAPRVSAIAFAALVTINGCSGGGGGTVAGTTQPTTPVPGSLSKAAGDAQTAVVGANVGVAPSVTLLDTKGSPMSGVAVTFTVGDGGGTVVGGAATTSSTGVATVTSWRLGAAPGANTLVATSAGVSAVTFGATAITDPCTTTLPLAFGTTANATLATIDCLLDNQYYGDIYAFTIPAGQRAQLDMISTAFDPWLDLAGPAITDYAAFDDNSGGGTASRIRLLSAPGQFIATANSFSPRQTGAYTLGVTNWSGDAAGCEVDVWVVPSATVHAQAAATTDCSFSGTGGPFHGDGFNFIAIGGRTYTITMASTAVDPALRLFDGITGAAIQVDDNSGGGTTARITWTPATTAMGVVLATTAVGGTTGAYSLTIAGPATSVITPGATALRLAAPLSRPLGRVRAVRPPASAGVGAPWAFRPTP